MLLDKMKTEYKKYRNIWIVLCAVILSMNGCGLIKSSAAEQSLTLAAEESEGTSVRTALNADQEPEKIFVYICGQVKKEGVYEMPFDCRVYQVIDEAGGTKKNADLSSLNQAAKVQDGEKIYIPAKGETLAVQESGSTEDSSFETGSSMPSDGKVNINTAGKEELMSLNSIGEARAESIIRYREQNGTFGRTEDLKQVEGIGDGIYERVKDDICIG